MNLIVVVDENWGIGKDGGLLCHLSTDLKYFKQTTLDSRVVMGRKTLESFPNGKPLPKRENIVLTKNTDYQKDGVTLCVGVDELWDILARDNEKTTFVIGGGSIYKQLLPYCDKAYITRIHQAFPADTFFPNLDTDEAWVLAQKGDIQEESGIQFSFDVYERA